MHLELLIYSLQLAARIYKSRYDHVSKHFIFDPVASNLLRIPGTTEGLDDNIFPNMLGNYF
jgi:hypothetical protein